MRIFSEWVKKREARGRIARVAAILSQLVEANQVQSASEHMWTDQGFLSWLKSHGVEWGRGVPRYSDGGVGRAYFLGDKVVKFTNNRVEGNVANMVAGNPESPTRIISVYRVPAQPLWAILQEKVDMNLPEKIKKAADLLMTYVSDTDLDQFPTSMRERKKIASEVVKNYSQYGAAAEDVPFILEMMDVLDKLYRTTGFFHDDAVPQNLGLHGGKVVIPDLGPNQPRDFNAREKLDRLHQNRQSLGLPAYSEI